MTQINRQVHVFTKQGLWRKNEKKKLQQRTKWKWLIISNRAGIYLEYEYEKYITIPLKLCIRSVLVLVPFPLLRVAWCCCICHDVRMQCVWMLWCMSQTAALDRSTSWLQGKMRSALAVAGTYPFFRLLDVYINDGPRISLHACPLDVLDHTLPVVDWNWVLFKCIASDPVLGPIYIKEWKVT